MQISLNHLGGPPGGFAAQKGLRTIAAGRGSQTLEQNIRVSGGLVKTQMASPTSSFWFWRPPGGAQDFIFLTHTQMMMIDIQNTF